MKENRRPTIRSTRHYKMLKAGVSEEEEEEERERGRVSEGGRGD